MRYWALPFEAILPLKKLASNVNMSIMQLCQSSGIEFDSSKSKPWDDDTLAQEHWDGFRILMYNGKKKQCFYIIYGVEDFEVHSIYMQVDILAT